MQMFDVTDQTLESMFDHIGKHLEMCLIKLGYVFSTRFSRFGYGIMKRSL